MWSNIQHIIRPVLYASECWTPSVIDMLKLELNDRAHSVYQPPRPLKNTTIPSFLPSPPLILQIVQARSPLIPAIFSLFITPLLKTLIFL